MKESEAIRLQDSVGRAPAGWRGVAVFLAVACGALHSPLGWVVLLAAIGVPVATDRLPSPGSPEARGDAA